MMTVIMTGFIPMFGNYVIGSENYHEENDFPDNPHVPNVLPVYSSYYNDEENKLYIYGTEKNTLVKIMYEGQIVLFDIIQSGNLPAIYDFSNGKSGMYQVIVSDETTILTSFEFYKD